MKYASIIPLIGGETFGMEHVFNQRPEYILSYSAFEANDSQLLQHYNNEVPYYKLDEGGSAPYQVDVVNSVCPCAGLSTLSTTHDANNPTNDWMITSSEYVLENVKPKVLWGENSPHLANNMGKEVVKKLRGLANKYGYTFSLYKTKSMLHGLSQVRNRSFYFFWKDKRIPLFDYYNKPYIRIEDQIRSSARNDFDPMTELLANNNTPSQDPYYKYILEEIHGGISHQDFTKMIDKSVDVLSYIEKHNKYNVVSEWMEKHNFDREAKSCMRKYEKLESGGNIMRKITTIVNDYIGAFVGHMPSQIVHPDADRYLNVRECLDIMGMPKDFQLQGGAKNINMICQNVPVTTAADMAYNIKKYLDNDREMLNTEYVRQDNVKQSYEKENQVMSLF